MAALLTYCDDATGERTELSAAELGAWSARTAGMLRDGFGLKAGDRAAVLLPPHWQTAAVLLGAWSIGVTVSFQPWSTAGLAPAEGEPYDAVFAARDRIGSWLETIPEGWHRFVLGLAPNAAPTDDVPGGYRDYITEVAEYPDAAPSYGLVDMAGPASPDGTSYQQLAAVAKGVAQMIGLQSGDRVLVHAPEQEQPLKWLLAPLIAGASIVIVANARPGSESERRASEGITHVI